jgi:predicted nucleic acid-binding protein
LVTSEFILGELQKTLAGKFGASDLQAQEAAGLLRSRMEVVVRAVLPTPVARDASGDAVLGTAVAGAATCLITGDKDLLVLKRFGEIDILTNKPQAASRKLPPAPKKRGPKPDVLKIEGDWREAIKKSLKKKKPPEGWPK